jgi:hypothetical protein
VLKEALPWRDLSSILRSKETNFALALGKDESQ